MPCGGEPICYPNDVTSSSSDRNNNIQQRNEDSFNNGFMPRQNGPFHSRSSDKESSSDKLLRVWDKDEEIVITGIGGRYP